MSIVGLACPNGHIVSIMGIACPNGPIVSIVNLACPNGPIVSIMGLAYPNGPIVSIMGQACPNGHIVSIVDLACPQRCRSVFSIARGIIMEIYHFLSKFQLWGGGMDSMLKISWKEIDKKILGITKVLADFEHFSSALAQ